MLNNFFRLRVYAPAIAILLLSSTVFAGTPYVETEKPNVAIRDPRPEKLQPAPEEQSNEGEGVVTPLSEQELENLDEEHEPHLTVADVDFNTIESYGLLEQSRGEGLGKKFYNSSRRSVMTALVRAMPASKWHVMQDLGNQVLLTSANASVIENDVQADFSNGADLFTIRIAKMMQRGFYREAYALFTRMNIDPYNEKLAILGVTSMLLNAQKPLACVEMKTFDAPFKQDIFWKEMDAYCILSMSDGNYPEKQAVVDASKQGVLKQVLASKDYRFPYTPGTFDKLSLFEKALLVSENRLDISGLTPQAYALVPGEHIQAILALQNVSNEAKILLNARGVETGVITPNEFAKVYIRMGRKAEKEKKPLTGLDHISTLYWKRADTFLPEARQATISEIYTHVKTYGYALLVPFLDQIGNNLSPQDFYDLDKADALTRAYLISGKEMPAGILERIKALPAPDALQQKRKDVILTAAALLSGEKDNSPEKLKEIYAGLTQSQVKRLAGLKDIIENIDNRTGSYAKVQIAYEKGFDRSGNKGYMIPAADLINQLDSSSSKHATGETVLLCNLILRGMDQRTVNANVLADAAKALSEVGLGKQAQRLMAEAVLSITE